MAQINGAKRNQRDPQQRTQANLAALDTTDHKPNSALAVSNYIGPQSRLIDDDGSGIIYVGEVAPGFMADVTEPIWRIMKIDKTANPITIGWAVTPAAGNAHEKFAMFDHIWNDRAALTYL